MKSVRLVWSVCLMAVGFTSVIVFLRTLGLALPDAAVRTLGIIDLLALPVLGYTTVRLLKKRGEEG